MSVSKKKPTEFDCADPTRPCPAEGMADRIAQLSETMAVHAERMELSIARIEELVDKASKVLFGNGTPGIVLRLDRLEVQSDLRLKKEEQLRKLAIGLMIALLGQAIITAGGVVWAIVRMAVKTGAL